jgi:hypothetical protein
VGGQPFPILFFADTIRAEGTHPFAFCAKAWPARTSILSRNDSKKHGSEAPHPCK